MTCLKNVLSSVADFLHEAHKLGIIKEFSLTHCDIDYEEVSGANELLSKFFQTVNDAKMTTQALQLQFQKEKVPEDSSIEFPVKNDMVQIQIDTNEMKRRISSFIHRKRKEVDEWNIQEFCGRSYVDEEDPSWENQDSCARVDAVFIPRRGCKSHIKVSKVENNYGPQTQAKKIKTENGNENILSEVVEERLQHMEYHLKLHSDSSVRANTFQRLKNLEDRILYLEGLSPEYIHLSNTDYSSPKKKNIAEKERLYSNWSIPELNKRIETLKEYLKKK